MNSVHRYHIPIITNENVEFDIAGEKNKMLPGECWEIHNGKLHSVSNSGSSDRVHLIIDIFPTNTKD
jgi:quercetin dioxygenase-like cupin family protein